LAIATGSHNTGAGIRTGKDYERNSNFQASPNTGPGQAVGPCRGCTTTTTPPSGAARRSVRPAEPLLGVALTWSSHTYAGNANHAHCQSPTRPSRPVTRASLRRELQVGLWPRSRHEIDMPFFTGAVSISSPTPWAKILTGDAFHNIGSTTPLTEESVRHTGTKLVNPWTHLGMRGSFETWRKVIPRCKSNVQLEWHAPNGLRPNSSFSESTNPFGRPAVHEVDTTPALRRGCGEHLGRTGRTVRPRFFAVRSGAGSSVTAPYQRTVATEGCCG